MWNIQNLYYLLLPEIVLINVVSVNSEANCTELRDAFANYTSEFISCAIQHSRPIKMCENCVFSYINTTESYNNMKTLSDKNGTHCIDKLINLDRLQIVQTLFSNSFELWNNAKCYECFEIVNNSLTPNKSRQTLTFNDNYDKFMNCINQTDINDTTICSTCMHDYLVLDDYYASISDENEKISVCMDIVDSMNTTRTFWSQKCCKYRKHDEYIFMASTVAVLIITLCFYVLAQMCSVNKTPTILQQTRLAETLNQCNYSE